MVGRICGTGSYAPGLVWDNEKLSQMVDTSDAWIWERTGIRRRHIAQEKETPAFMAAQAAKAALDNAGIEAKEVDLILAATVSPDKLMPCTACEVQKELGAERAAAFDVNAACSGFLFALNTAQAYIGQGLCDTALVVGTERLSALVDWSDRATCILFGDGAGAVVLQKEEKGRYAQAAHSEGAGGDALTCTCRNQNRFAKNPGAVENCLKMDGKEVFQFAVSRVPEVICELLEKEQIAKEDVKYYLLHQANGRIVRLAAKKLGERMEKFPMNMEEYGNTSSASIPLLLDELNRAGKLTRGDILVLAGFGAGLSYGASCLRW